MADKVYTPLPPPDALYAKNPQPPLTPNERDMYDAVYNHFTAPEYRLPGVEQDKGELIEEEKMWLSYECILRFLRATKWKTSTTILRLESTLRWRREFGLYDLITAEHVEPEALTGKEILFGFDVKGHPSFYMIPSRQNTEESIRQIHYAVWMLERCIDLMAPGVETLDILINFADRAKNPSFGTSRTVLNILQDHYPERLGLALIINVPFLVNTFFKLIYPFIDPITREKIKFNPDLLGNKDKAKDKDGNDGDTSENAIFVQDQLMKDGWGGMQEFEYIHEKYWPALVNMAKERRERWLAKWKELGAKIGIKEWDYKQPAVAEDGLIVVSQAPGHGKESSGSSGTQSPWEVVGGDSANTPGK